MRAGSELSEVLGMANVIHLWHQLLPLFYYLLYLRYLWLFPA